MNYVINKSWTHAIIAIACRSLREGDYISVPIAVNERVIRRMAQRLAKKRGWRISVNKDDRFLRIVRRIDNPLNEN